MRPTANQRLFVAAYPPPEVAERLVLLLAALDLPGHRVTPAAQVHLTLQFIGDTPARELDAVIESVARSASGVGVFELALTRLVALPERGSARLIAAETSSPPALLELQRRLAHRLAAVPRPKAGDRFLPHMTLCRFGVPASPGVSDRVRSALAAVDAAALALPVFEIRRVALMRSVLKPQGAEHVEVRGFEL